jgi:hypothetical protein
MLLNPSCFFIVISIIKGMLYLILMIYGLINITIIEPIINVSVRSANKLERKAKDVRERVLEKAKIN